MTIDDCLTQTRAHILTQTLAGLPSASVARVLLAPNVTRAVVRLNAMADAGDVLGTQQAAQAWNRALRQAIQEVQP